MTQLKKSLVKRPKMVCKKHPEHKNSVSFFEFWILYRSIHFASGYGDGTGTGTGNGAWTIPSLEFRPPLQTKVPLLALFYDIQIRPTDFRTF